MRDKLIWKLIPVLIIFSIFHSCRNQPTNQSDIFIALQSDKKNTVLNFVTTQKFNPDTINGSGLSPLSVAVKQQNFEHIELLTEYGVATNVPNNSSKSPIYLALLAEEAHFSSYNKISKKEKIIKYLIENGALVGTTEDYRNRLIDMIKINIKNAEVRNLAIAKINEISNDEKKYQDSLRSEKLHRDSLRRINIRAERLNEYKTHNTLKLVSDPQIQNTDSFVKFKLNDVEPASKNIDQEPYNLALQNRLKKKLIYGNTQEYYLIPSNNHPVMHAVELAYAQHRPLVLSPDIIWLMICQGFSTHINLNHEKFRSKLVDFQNTKKIEIVREDFVLGNSSHLWPGIIKEFSSKTHDNIKDNFLYENLIPEYSTTGEKERIAFQITAMEATNHYFKYVMYACGIPEITLEGQPDDWRKIRKQIEYFRQFELGWWVDRLIPVLDQLISTAEGQPNLTFWSEIFRKDQLCNHEITGWITYFFPYIHTGMGYIPNPLVLNEPIFNENILGFENGLEMQNFSKGLAYVPFTVTDKKGVEYSYQFAAGFVGISQISAANALKPEINWLVTE